LSVNIILNMQVIHALLILHYIIYIGSKFKKRKKIE